MNDTEARLRDYLQAKAGTVPDADHGPGLELDGSSKRGWVPIVLAAATIGAILVLAVPFLTRLGDNQPAPAATPTARPTGPVSAEAPRLPYAITLQNNPDNPLDTWWATIHDGKQTVKNPGVKGDVIARLGEGWLVMTGYGEANKDQAAIVSPAGKVRPIGPVQIDGLAVSPDRKQLAVVVAPYQAEDTQVIVVNVDDGKEVSSVRILTPMLMAWGWNKEGIWLTPAGPDRKPAFVWQPGSKEARTVPDLDGEIAVARGAGTIGYVTSNGKAGACAKAATLGANGLEVKREYCSNTAAGTRISFSPEGGTMLLTGAWVAVDVAGGNTIKLRLPAGFRATYPAVFEDATDAIVLGEVPGKAQTMYRCRVTTGECKALRTEKSGEMFALAKP